MDVFISHSTRDDAAVGALAEDIRQAQHKVWLDADLEGGEVWWNRILHQIRSCDVVVFALSDDSIRSGPCRAELTYAEALGIPILPVQIGPVSNVALNPLGDLEAIDYRKRTSRTGIALVQAMAVAAARRGPPPSPPPTPPPIPFEYLMRLSRRISSAESISAFDQVALVAQLRDRWEHEEDPRALANLRKLLQDFRARPDLAVTAAHEIDALLKKRSRRRAGTATVRPSVPKQDKGALSIVSLVLAGFGFLLLTSAGITNSGVFGFPGLAIALIAIVSAGVAVGRGERLRFLALVGSIAALALGWWVASVI